MTPVFVGREPKLRAEAFQTFNLAPTIWRGISIPLLDRFLACMKPASTLNASLVLAFFLCRIVAMRKGFLRPPVIGHASRKSDTFNVIQRAVAFAPAACHCVFNRSGGLR